MLYTVSNRTFSLASLAAFVSGLAILSAGQIATAQDRVSGSPPSGVGGYTGEAFANWVEAHWPRIEVEVVKRSDDVQGFVVLPRRWVVERTFGWLMRHRRLVRDYECTESSAEAWIQLAMIRIQLRRLA